MVYRHFKILPRTAYDEVLRDKAFDIAKNPKYDRYQCGPTSMVTATHANKSAVAMHANRSANHTEIEINLENWQLAKEIGKTIIRKPKK